MSWLKLTIHKVPYRLRLDNLKPNDSYFIPTYEPKKLIRLLDRVGEAQTTWPFATKEVIENKVLGVRLWYRP